MSFPDEETMIWAKKKYGGNGGAGNGRLCLHRRFDSTTEMQAQPSLPMEDGGSGYTLYKFFTETPTPVEIEGGTFLVRNTGLVGFTDYPLSPISDMGIAWGVTYYEDRIGEGVELANILCVSEAGAEAMGVEAGIYIADKYFAAEVKEVYIIGG